MSVNRVVLIGRMVRDPELRTTNTGKNVIEFSIAVNKRIKPSNSNDPSADFFRVKAWNQSADYVNNYGGKGRMIAVDGRLESRKYVDKDGNNRELIEVVADNVNFLDRKDEGEGGQPAGGQSGGTQGTGSRTTANTQKQNQEEYDPFADE